MWTFRPLALVAALIPAAATAEPLNLAPEMYGTYAPDGDCSRQPRIIASKAGVHLDTPAGKRGPLPVMVSYTFGGGAQYDGIQTWVLVKHGGKDRWGDDRQPVMMTFNADEKKGALRVERTDRQVPIDGPLTSIVTAGSFRICGKGAAAAIAPNPGMTQRPAPAPVTPNSRPGTPAAGFAAVVHALLQPATAPAGSFYDWRFIERAPHVRWAALPPEMLEKPSVGGHYFRRNGTIALGGQPLQIMAAGARSMVMAFYVKNAGQPLGEAAVVAALRGAGLTVTTARCGIDPRLLAPTWYRVGGAGKRPALLWIARPRGASSPWEGFSLSLDETLKPMTAQERQVYTDRCA